MRTMTTMATTVVALQAFAAVALLSRPAIAQRYLITDLPPLPGYVHSYATGVNDGRQVVGYMFGANGLPPQAFLYHPVSGLGPLDVGSILHSYAEAINNAGQIAGTADYHAFLWDAGNTTDLGALADPPDDYSYGMAINMSGQVAGFSEVAEPNDRHAFRVDPNGPLEDLGPADAVFSRAFGLNDAGIVVGEIGDEDSSIAARWDPNGVALLGVLPGALPQSEAHGINSENVIVGASLYESEICITCLTACVWEDGTITDLGRYPDQLESIAYAINDAGQIVGSADAAFAEPHATLWQAHEMIDLNRRIPRESGWVLAAAWDISENAHIVGYGFRNGQTAAHGFLLTPLPPIPGDTNCDGVVDFVDINPFVKVLIHPTTYEELYPGCRPSCDVNQDGAVDFFDINPFVDLLMR